MTLKEKGVIVEENKWELRGDYMDESKMYMKDRVVKMFRENPTMMGKDVADELGVSRQYVARILKEAGEDSIKRNKEVLELKYKRLEEEYKANFGPDVTIRDMGEILGVNRAFVSELSERTGLYFSSLKDVRRRNRVKDIKELQEKGMTLQEVADELGISIGYVVRMLRWSREQDKKEESKEVKEDSKEENHISKE